MSRYRPPRRAGTPLITAAGAARLREELDELWLRKRPAVTQAVSEAAALGDRSENAEYIYGKKMLREIDSRVRFLRKRLEALKVVDQPPSDPSRIYFSAHIELEDEDGKILKLRIVGPDEIDPKQQHISIDSPMARALLGKQLDDEVCVMAPGGERLYWVTDIRY
ncbi:MAG TPA: transcription elongation factor GreB [Pseudomonas sp.]|uniref:Transcription elongation factor GreB n=1 Tax=Halopseudomonas pachastrellae TaxID=254161 RepID=A0A1S8DJF7_9GAMM|nr:transcription elongation factor GreB [Halopseudomonas pachastrellae]MAP29535.1 transcription elongation factor GreB [Pseudomonas sp.]MBU30708.1 transcription elongation factor GreB [Pseudomonadales bacterium]MED5490922.1 transcription elongation factor GreB [Pseudomonadota bacterium]MAQ52078.1 transcription elongation factor GreB [Pseudomonas sp.]ONM45525.1 transcription elongation factor GreB [Halopseudomonas pachastrellae]|tara:strand:- start:3160 stop:3654 length:495 start_codon:yes stop_codon:yes gene_type:complete